jgi:hypothetical protein
VLARKPVRSAGRYRIRFRRVFTSAVNSAMVCLVRFARESSAFGRRGCGRAAGAGGRVWRPAARPASAAGCWPRSPAPPGCGRGGPRCAPSAASGPGRTRPRRLPRRPGPPPSFYLRPGLLPPGGDLLLVALGGLAGGHLHAPADAVQQQIQPGQGVGHAEPLAHHLGDARQRPASVRPAPRRRAGIQQVPQLGQLGGAKPAARPARPLGGSAGRPPAAGARRHRLADIRVTRNRAATSRSLAPSSIHSAAASRTRSRRARSPAVSPPPSGYLMLLA